MGMFDTLKEAGKAAEAAIIVGKTATDPAGAVKGAVENPTKAAQDFQKVAEQGNNSLLQGAAVKAINTGISQIASPEASEAIKGSGIVEKGVQAGGAAAAFAAPAVGVAGMVASNATVSPQVNEMLGSAAAALGGMAQSALASATSIGANLLGLSRESNIDPVNTLTNTNEITQLNTLSNGPAVSRGQQI